MSERPSYITLQKWKLMQEAWKEETQVGVEMWTDRFPKTREEGKDYRAWKVTYLIIDMVRRGIK